MPHPDRSPTSLCFTLAVRPRLHRSDFRTRTRTNANRDSRSECTSTCTSTTMRLRFDKDSDFLTSAEMEMALFERDPPAVSACGRVPTRLRRVARWRQAIAANNTIMRVPRRMAQPFEWATRRGRVGTGVGAVRPGCRKSDEKVSSPFPPSPQGPPEVRKSEIATNLATKISLQPQPLHPHTHILQRSYARNPAD